MFEGLVTNYILVAVKILIRFLVTPFYLSHLGAELMGLGSFIREIENYLKLSKLGITRGIASLVAKEIQPEISDAERQTTIRKLRAGAQLQFILSVLAFLFSIVLTIFIDSIVQGLSPENVMMARLFTLMYGFGLAMIISSGVYLSILEGSQLIGQSNVYNLINAMLAAAVGVALVHFGFSLYGIAIASLVSSLFLFIQLRVRTVKMGFRLNLLKFTFDWEAMRSIISLSGWILIAEIGAVFSFNSSRVILGITPDLGLIAVNKFALMSAVPLTFMAQANRFARIMRPGMTQLYHSNGDDTRIKQISRFLLKFTGMLSASVFCFLYIINGPFVIKWVGEEYYAGALPNILIAVFAALFVWTFAFKVLLEVRFEFKRRGWSIGLSGIIAVILSLVLVRKLGISGVILGCIIGEIAVVFPAIIIHVIKWMSGGRGIILLLLQILALPAAVIAACAVAAHYIAFRPESWLEIISVSALMVSGLVILGGLWLKNEIMELGILKALKLKPEK